MCLTYYFGCGVVVLNQARIEMSHYFSKLSEPIDQFIDRVGRLSGSLVKRGRHIINSLMETEYEFSNLAFQEYFAAIATLRRDYPGATRINDVVKFLEEKNAFEKKGGE